ncbi:YwqG family protein [Rothia mucilaginosa]
MPKNKPSEETLAQARRVIDALNERGARKQAIRLQVTRPDAPLPQTASKFGGRPYLPAGESAPTNEKGEPLGMIAQINCADLPENDIYPATGLLQFWINPNDEKCLWGYDYKNPLSQKNHRVVYYETLDEPNPDAPFPTVNWDKYDWPLGPEGEDVSEATTEYALAFETWEQSFLDGGLEIYDQFADAWDEMYPDQKLPENPNARDNASYNLLEPFESDERDYSYIGGYPSFVQNDPRDEFEELRGHTVNLLTIESEWGEDAEEGVYVMWGDAGAANWLITPEALAARDFSQVVFEWACG